MSSSLRHWIGYSLLVLMILGGAGASIYLYLELTKLQEQHAELTDDLERCTERNAVFLQRFKEQQALEATLMRQKRSLEGLLAQAKGESEELVKEKEVLTAELEALKETHERIKEQLLARVNDVIRLFQIVNNERDWYRFSYLRHMAERNEDVILLGSQIDERENQVLRLDGRIERCMKYNTELTEISVELLNAYQDRSFLETMLEKEPFIQTKQIQIEHFVQRYIEKVDNLEFN